MGRQRIAIDRLIAEMANAVQFLSEQFGTNDERADGVLPSTRSVEIVWC